ncbi:MAG: hypothetical protein LBU90_10060 [Bacteroidales bacterium]|jgi:hypothetical protein|nr:hypothetical protein [Bacteroidales bacterium]
MKIQQRIQAFAALGSRLQALVAQPTENFERMLRKTEAQNPWFTHANSVKMITNVAEMLTEEGLQRWISSYNFPEKQAKTIAVIMAGNIPMVGFHDALCVLLSGNALTAKLSSKDAVLLPFVFELLVEIAPEFADYIHIETHTLHHFDAIIATGSNNSARYFDYYFGKYTHIIRKTRNSVAVLTGSETAEEMSAVGRDIFDYFGLGCRSVSKLYVPRAYDFTKLFDAWEEFGDLAQHNKYMNNYEYNKSILLVSATPHFDTGYALFTEHTAYNSAIAVNHFEYYDALEQVSETLQHDADVLQCVLSNSAINGVKILPLGTAQKNTLFDYADGIDTLEFLINL